MAETQKRILIFSHGLELGGAERALIGLLHRLQDCPVQVELFLMRHTGPLLNQIPPGVRLLPELPGYACLAVPAAEVLGRGQFGVALGRLMGKAAAGLRKRKLGLPAGSALEVEYSHRYTCAFLPDVGAGEYDLAVSFLTPHYMVAEKVRAKRKIAWIHTDYTAVAIDRESERRMWSRYDFIAAISAGVEAGFCRVFPELADRVVRIGNILPEAYIRACAAAPCPVDFPEDGSIRLLSVGRFCEAKNFDNVPDICRRIRETGLDVTWYLIGFGSDEARLRRKIAESGMGHHVLVLGRRENPYPYIAHCDVYVQPSRYEGQAVAVREAQLLAKPVVITRYPTAASQLADGVDGICVPMDNAGCAAGIAQLLRNPARMKELRESCHGGNYAAPEQAGILLGLLEREEGKCSV